VKNSKGFSIIEVMVALLILTIFLLGSLNAFFIYSKSHYRNLLRDTASEILFSELESLRSENFTAIDNSTLNKGNHSCLEALQNHKNSVYLELGNRKWEFGKFYKVDNKDSSTKKVTVEVCWFFNRKLYSISGSTLLVKR